MSERELIAVIAGNGSFPIEFVKTAKSLGHSVLTIALVGEASAELESISDSYLEIRVGQVGKLLGILKKHSPKQVAFAGGVKKAELLDLFGFDVKAFSVMAKAGSVHDDVILRQIAEEIEVLGCEVIAATKFLPDSVPEEGCLSKRELSKQEQEDAEVGIVAARGIGALDLGQSVIVHSGVVTAIEAVDGTDATILRGGDVAGTAGKFQAGKGAVLVKLPKPQQDLRFDLPTIGPKTIENCHKAGVSAIIIESGKTLILDKDAILDHANALKIAIIAI